VTTGSGDEVTTGVGRATMKFVSPSQRNGHTFTRYLLQSVATSGCEQSTGSWPSFESVQSPQV
jgi:hypothetical protein